MSNSDSNKKDLTGIIELVERSRAESKNAPASAQSAGGVQPFLEEAPIEKVDQFESLEDYAKQNPELIATLSDPSESPPQEASPLAPNFEVTPPAAEPVSTEPVSTENETLSGLDFSNDFELTPATDASNPGEGTSGLLGLDFAPTEAAVSTPVPSPALSNESEFSFPPPESTALQSESSASVSALAFDPEPPSPAEPLAEERAPAPVAEASSFAPPAPQTQTAPPLAPALPTDGSASKTPTAAQTLTTSPAAQALSTLQKQSSRARESQALQHVPAAFPFSLLILGRLKKHEQERLIELIEQEKLGVSEDDLRIQFENDKILIPRISEYAGVMLVQALRSTSAELRLGPSDEIFATADTRDETAPSLSGSSPSGASLHARPLKLTPSLSQEEQWKKIPLLSYSDWKNVDESNKDTLTSLESLGNLTVSTSLQSYSVEIASSREYEEALERLMLELQAKAHRRGADRVVDFRIHLTHLDLPSRYRITLTGVALGPKAQVQGEPPHAPVPAPESDQSL